MRAPFADLPGIEWADASDARITIEPATRPPAPGELEAWSELRARNPRLHNGPILSVRAADVDALSASIHAAIDGYRGLAVRAQRGVRTGVELLAVTGVLVARDRAGPRVLIAQRAPSTSSYPGMWELGPAGGIDPSADGAALDSRAVLGHLVREIAEELSDPPTIASASLVGLVRDRAACSLDLVVMAEVSPGDAHAPDDRRWEYTQARWASLDELARFDTPATIPPSRALIRLLGPRVRDFLDRGSRDRSGAAS